MENLPDFIGHVFEDITRQYLRRLNRNRKLPFIAKSFGTWRGKDKQGAVHDVDVLLESAVSKELLIGECKWREHFNVTTALEKLEHRANIFSDYECHKYLFTKKKLDSSNGQKATYLCTDNYFDFD